MSNKKLTTGQKLVGINSNLSGNQKVDEVKQIFADLIDSIDLDNKDDSDEKALIKLTAVQSLLNSQMLVVKALTFND